MLFGVAPVLVEPVILDRSGDGAVDEVARQRNASEEDDSSSALPEYSHPNLSQPTGCAIKVQGLWPPRRRIRGIGRFTRNNAAVVRSPFAVELAFLTSPGLHGGRVVDIVEQLSQQ
ncbi:MAG: hypothetical protein U0547_12660 [Dehalococcoidia bacterium]